VIRGDSCQFGNSEIDDKLDSEDDALGGYGFFDAGMLLQALKGSQKEELPNEKKVYARRSVGKKLKLDDSSTC